jgi:RNA polymerase sigma factor (sigma-70 family)
MYPRLSERTFFQLELFLHLETCLAANSPRRILDQETIALLYRAIAHLPTELRQICILSYLEHFSIEEIADLTGLSVQTVESVLQHARQLIRKKLIACAIREHVVL